MNISAEKTPNAQEKRIIVHVSEVSVAQNGGMARIEWNWKRELEKRGYRFIHIGPEEVGGVSHPFLFPIKAYFYFKSLKIKPEFFIVHEPASGVFCSFGIPCFVESHGVEQRYWEFQKEEHISSLRLSWKTKLLFPLWRLYTCNKGLKKSSYLLLSNYEDKSYCLKYYRRNESDILVFKNGVNIYQRIFFKFDKPEINIVYNATWIERKGKTILVDAAKYLYSKGYKINYLLMGTGGSQESILRDWPPELHSNVKIVPRFESEMENGLLLDNEVFVLPTYYEGQSLALLQAMAIGLCCITTNCCGQKDIIIDGENGLLIERGSPKDLAMKIESLYKDRLKMVSIGNKAFESMANRTWESVNKENVDWILSKILV